MKTGNATYPLLFLSVFIPSLGGYAQMQAVKADSAAVFSTIDKAETFFSASRYDSALYYCDKAEAMARRTGFRKGIAYALVEKTDVLMDKNDLAQAEIYPTQTQSIGAQLKDSLIMSIAWMQQAQVKMYGNNADAAIPFFEKCARYFEHHPSKYAALAYNDFGYTWGLKGDLNKKAEQLLKAIRVFEALNLDNYGERAAAYNNLSSLYYDLNQRSKAIEYGKQSVYFREKSGDIGRLSLGCCNLSQYYVGIDDEAAVKYQLLCVKYAEQSGDEARIIHSYITSSLVASSRKDTRKALDYESKAIALLEKSRNNPVMLSRRYISMGMGLAALKDDSARVMDYFNKALALSRQANDKYNLRDVYQQMSIYYKEHADYKEAYGAYNKYVLYRDSLINENTRASIAEIETRYKTEKKDNEISRLSAAQRIKELQLEKQDALIAANLLEAQRRKKEIELLSQEKEVQQLRIARQDEQLVQQVLVTKNNEQQLRLAEQEKQLQEKQLKNTRQARNFILAGVLLLALVAWFIFNRYQLKRKIEEQKALLAVRNNIAKDLHDEIGSALTSIKILSEVSGKNVYKDQAKTSGYLREITEQSGRMQQGMSDIVWAIAPDNDRLENLVARMREYISRTLEPKNIQTIFTVDETALSHHIGMQQRRDLLLIFKEAINNAAKYAEASCVQLRLGLRNHTMHMAISDNGKGFDTTKLTSSNGLRNMRQRAGLLNGTFSLSAAPGEGTTVEVSFPAV
ncbi:MAG: histidine kinase [Bacteroidetes bacterium]|nr:histidine kinase [Bacteroidota bacterium]